MNIANLFRRELRKFYVHSYDLIVFHVNDRNIVNVLIESRCSFDSKLWHFPSAGLIYKLTLYWNFLGHYRPRRVPWHHSFTEYSRRKMEKPLTDGLIIVIGQIWHCSAERDTGTSRLLHNGSLLSGIPSVLRAIYKSNMKQLRTRFMV
jgi:hypothetical protein